LWLSAVGSEAMPGPRIDGVAENEKVVFGRLALQTQHHYISFQNEDCVACLTLMVLRFRGTGRFGPSGTPVTMSPAGVLPTAVHRRPQGHTPTRHNCKPASSR